jgi:ATP-dependent DNA helicase DinG
MEYELLPIKLEKTPRPEQVKLLDFTIDSIRNNKKFILIDAPVGLGKSFYSVMFMDWFKKNYDRSAQFDVLTNSKILQEQYTNDYEFMNSLWGIGSYDCSTYSTDCGTGSEFCKIKGVECEFCPYKSAKWKFENGDVALTNYHLFLTYMVYIPMAWKRSSRVLIIDEGHSFENTFCDFITTKISKPLLKANGFTDDETVKALNVFGKYPEDLSDIDFINIVKTDFLPIVKTVLNRLARQANEEKSMQAIKYFNSLSNNLLKWESLYTEYNKNPENWIVEIEQIKKTDKDNKVKDIFYEFTAQPVWADPYLDQMIWSKYDYVISMSGTFLDKSMTCEINAFDLERTAYISLPSPFPVENRPIYYFNGLGKQSFKTKEITWSKQKPIVEKILKKHKTQKGIIHTANYEIQSWINNQINNPNILTHDSSNRSEVLNLHYQSESPTILVSPSMMVGVDLYEEMSRHQTIIKIPYPNLGSKKVKKRMETRKDWYTWATVVDIIQSYGRSIRSKEDKADTYVLDSCFSDVLKWGNRYFPQWFKDAIKYIN